MHDLVIRNATVVTGDAAGRVHLGAGVAVADGRLTHVGAVDGHRGSEEHDAAGRSSFPAS
jgi:N-acyl-D-aspartate/D-glutamate deacylase